MSPLTLQATRLASRQVFRATQQAAFRRSMTAQVARQYSTAGHAAADWGRIVRSRASIMLIYFPGMFMALGWPYLAYLLLDRS